MLSKIPFRTFAIIRPNSQPMQLSGFASLRITTGSLLLNHLVLMALHCDHSDVIIQ